MEKPFDVILWGATGFTGKLVAEYLVKAGGDSLRWALAGRNLAKLEAVRADLAKIKPAAADLALVLADSDDRPTLAAMVAQTRVICSTVGPYVLYGEPLVAECVAQGVDYCDLTGEVPFMKAMADGYHGLAQASGARIVHACGFDSVPSDLGVYMLQKQALAVHGRACNDVRFYVAGSRGGFSGGTIASLLNVVAAAGKDKALRRVLANPYVLSPDGNPTGVRVADQQGARWDADFQRWTGLFFMASINTRVVRRSNYLLDYLYGRDFQYSETLLFPAGVLGWLAATTYSMAFGVFMALASVPFTRKLLARFVLPAPGEGPNRQAIEKGYFKIKLVGDIPASAEQPAAVVRGEVVGISDPGYGETAKMFGEAALCLAFDPEVAEVGGGVLTPAAAMGEALLARLRAAGMTFVVE